MNRRFTLFVLGAMVSGILVGFILNQTLTDQAQLKQAVDLLGLATDIFLRLIKMIIGPLVFSTLVVGITHMEDTAAIGRVGVKTMAWFIFASLVSLTIGLIMVHLFNPGVGLGLPLPPENAGGRYAGNGEPFFKERCASCHDPAVGRAPSRAELEGRSACPARPPRPAAGWSPSGWAWATAAATIRPVRPVSAARIIFDMSASSPLASDVSRIGRGFRMHTSPAIASRARTVSPLASVAEGSLE